MRTTKIIIKNLFGIKETALSGKSVEISGPKGSGKTSILDSIRYALTNRSDRDYIIHQGADEGEIIIETDSGLTIDRKIRTTKADSIKVRDGNMLQTRPAEFLSGIFTPLQLNPVEFCQLSRQEKNRVILSLIEFKWDMNWIREQFGEIPQGVDYSKHILEVLADIQAENGTYFQSRQNLNRDIRNKLAFVADIAKDVPANYDATKWEAYPVSEKYRDLAEIKKKNNDIERARAFKSSYDDKIRGIEGTRDVAISAIDREIAQERTNLTGTIERLRAEIKAAEDKLAGLAQRREERVTVAQSEYEAAVAKLDKDVGVAEKYAGMEPTDTTALAAEIETADAMRQHLNEYKRMVGMQDEIDAMQVQAEELTRKIELARELPSQILAKSTIPVAGLTVKDGIPLINDLPISNLSDGELLELCVDITVSKPGQLGIILVDGAERLDKVSRERLYAKCKEKGLQLIATRVSDSNEMEVTEL
jgi:energy-coupling factor transporter ATP-binding protein EcfA2